MLTLRKYYLAKDTIGCHWAVVSMKGSNDETVKGPWGPSPDVLSLFGLVHFRRPVPN
jgi:hypothetical protein